MADISTNNELLTQIRGKMIYRDEYIAPDIELWSVVVEQGYGNSLEDPDEEEEIDW